MNELEKLYNVLIERGLYTKSFQEFQQRYSQDEEYKNKVYDVVSSKGLYTKGRNSFFQKYSGVAQSLEDLKVDYQEPKKKVATDSSSRAGSSVSARIPRFEAAKPEIAASESTRVPNVRIPQKEQAPDAIDEKLQQIQDDDFDKKLEAQKISAPLSYSNIFAKTIADLPADLGESWSVASAFIERQLGKAGFPGANPNLTARDLHFYKLSEDYRKFTDELFPSNKEDRSTFIGGVASGLGQVVPMFMTGGISAASKTKTAIDLAKTALTTGSKLTPFIKMGKDIAKQATSPAGLIGGSQMSSSMYRDAIESGATEDEAQRYAIENFFVGTIAESLPIQSMFSRILKKEPAANILRVLKEGGIGASEEALTEMWQTTYENWSAQRIYDFNREMLDGVGEAGAIGGTIGFMLNAALAALTGRRARVKNEDEAKTLDKSIEEVQSKINTVNKNNEDIVTLANELETLEPVVLKYGDSDFTFVRDKSGKMELAADPMTEEQALEVSSFLGKTYKSINFLVDEIESTDPLTPTGYKIVAIEKEPNQAEASYTIDGSKMDRNRFVAAVQEANTEDALNDLETTDPEVQKIINEKRAEITGQPVAQVEPQTQEGPVQEVVVDTVEETQPVEPVEQQADEVKKPKISEMAGETVTVRVGNKNVSGIVEVDEGGKATITEGNVTYEIPEDSEFSEFSRPVTINKDGDFVVNGDPFNEARIVVENGQKKALLVKEDGTTKAITNPKVVEEIEYNIALASLEDMNETEADNLLNQYEQQRKTEEPTESATDKTVAESDEDRKLREAFEEIDLIEEMALMELQDVESQAKLVEHTPRTMKEAKTYLVKKNPDGTYQATLNGKKVARKEVLEDLGKLFEQRASEDISKLQEQTNKLKEEVEKKLFGKEKPKAEPQVETQEEQTQEVDVFHGGSVKDIQIASKDNPLYVSESKSQASAYAKGNEGKVAKFKIDKNKLANEEEVRSVINELGLKPKDESWSVDELNIYELIDPNFDTAMPNESINRLFEELERRGYGGAEFLGSNVITLKNDINDIVIFNPKLVTKPAARARLSSGVEQQDTRTEEAKIVQEMDELAERMPEEAAFEEVQDAGKKDVGEAVAQNPTPEKTKKSFTKKILDFLGLSSENQLYKKIEDFANMPMMIGISDTLGSGVFKDALGNPMNVDGGLMFNFFRNPGLAWANVDKKYAENLVNQAKQVYNSNKELYDRLWKEGALPEGHIPYAIVRMGDDALYSNEAIFRYLSPWVKTLPLENRKKAIEVLKKELGVVAKKQTGINWIFDLQDNIENGSIENFDGLVSYVKDLKNSELTESARKSVESLETQLEKLKGDEAFSDGIDIIAEILDKKAPIAVLNFIEKNNITTVDELFDAISEDAVKRAKGDPNNKSDLSLPLRAFISTKIFSKERLKKSEPKSPFSKALLGETRNPLWNEINKLTLPFIKDQISEPTMLAARPGDIVAIMGIDVREGSSGVAQANHNNYGYGPKGRLIAYLKEPARAFDVFAELKVKAPRLFKPNKSKKYPSPESVVRQAGGVAYVDVPFRGARLLPGGTTALDLIIGKLRTAFPEVGVFTTEQEFDEFLKQEGIRSRKDSNGNTIYGITKDGKVFLNPENKSLRTPIHEFGHIWVDFLRSKASGKRGKELLDKGLKLVDGTQEYTEALEKYGERDLALEEALVELIATKGDTIINASQKSKFKNWLNALFKYIKEKFISTKDLFDAKKTNEVEFKKFIENMTIDDFMNVSLADLFGMSVVSKKFKASEASTSAKARMSLGKLPARVESEILNKISEQEALGKKPSEAAKEAIKYLKSTEAYNKLSERDKAKAIDGVKRLAGVRVKVLVDEVAALKQQMKDAEKLAEAKNELPNYQKFLSDFTSRIREMARGGKISTFKAGVIIGRVINTNPLSKVSVDKTIDYIGEVFDSANLAMKISRAKSLLKNAKRNIKSKIGQNQELFTAAKALLSIDPHFIPTPLIDDYLNVMEVIGERAKVLSIKDAGEMAAKMNVIINAVIKEAEAKANEEANAKPKREAKAKPTPEESAKAAELLIKKIESEKLNTSKVLDKNANAVARKVASINRKDMTELLSTDKDGVVDYSKLNLLLAVRENIKAGIVTNEALNLVTTVEQNRGVDTFSKLLPKINGMSILNGVTRTLGEVKSLITSKTGVQQAVRGTGTFNIDDVLGNFNDTTIYKLTFGKLASAKGKLDATLSDRAAKASAAEILFQKGVGIGPVRFTARTNNDVVKAKYKVQILLLQKEFESNPGNDSVSPAIDFVNATIKAIERKKSSLTKNDARILREIKSEFPSKDSNGNETLNFNKMEESLTENDKKAMKLIEEINASTAEEALFTSSVIRGNRVDILNNYVHHAVSDKGLMEQMVDLVNKLLEIGPGGKPSTKAGTLNERTPGAKAIIFDPVFSSMKGARETLTDFYMTPVIREVSGMLEKLENKVLDDNSTTEAQRDSVQAVKEAVREALEITFQNHFSEDTFGEAMIKAIQKLGYQSMLASLPRAGAELVSNMSYAVLSDPVTTIKSVGVADFAYSSDMLGFLENIGSSESTRLAGNEMLTSRYAESGFAAGYGRSSKSGARSKAMNYASFIADLTAGNLFRANDVTSDLIVSTPDKSITKPHYVQFFVDKFKELTGVELSNSDLRKISEGTSEYLSPEYEDAIAKSREDADLTVIRMAGSTNSFNTILKNMPRKTDKPWTSAYRAINSLMARFYLTEYGTLRSAIIALFKTGQISRPAAVGLIAASLTRMSMYLVAFGLLAKLFDSAIAELLDLEEPEEEEEDLMTTVKRSIVGSGVNALTRRTLGNVPYIPIALGVELMNEELGEDYGLRDGDYDPYKNSLVFSKINTKDLYTKSPYEIFGRVVAGPFAPPVATAFRAITLVGRANKEGSKPETKRRAMDELEQRISMEAIGNFGLIPFYKDSRRIMMNDFYARNYDKKEDSSFTITEKQIDLVRKSNPAAARRLRSFKEQQKKIEARQRAIKKKFEKKQTKSN